MAIEHRVKITWSEKLVRQGLPDVTQMIDPAILVGAPPGTDMWSLACRFDQSPAKQGSPSIAHVYFRFEEAPHEWLSPGARLEFFERWSCEHALVEVLE